MKPNKTNISLADVWQTGKGMSVWQDARQHQRSCRKMRLKLKGKFALEKYLIQQAQFQQAS